MLRSSKCKTRGYKYLKFQIPRLSSCDYIVGFFCNDIPQEQELRKSEESNILIYFEVIFRQGKTRRLFLIGIKFNE